MPAYLVGAVKVTNPDMFAKYREEVRPLVEKYGGRFLAGAGRIKMLEGPFDPDGAVIIEFPSYEKLLEWYGCEEYQPLLELRQQCADTRLMVLDGS